MEKIEIIETRLGRKYLRVPIELVGVSEHEHLDLPTPEKPEDIPTWMVIDPCTITAFRPAKYEAMHELTYTGIHFGENYIIAKVDPTKFEKLFLSL